MSRRNEIKKDIWAILREVYDISEYRDITDKQNEFLNKVIEYLEDNISLRRKGDKRAEEEDFTPLTRPEATKLPEPVIVATPEEPKKSKKTKTAAKSETTVVTVAPKIDLNVLPPHLRKYAIVN